MSRPLAEDEPLTVDHPRIAQLALRMQLDKLRAAKPKRPERGIPSWMLNLAIQTRKNAKVRGISYELSDADLKLLVTRCDGCCEVSGMEFIHDRMGGGKRQPFRPSLDRRDNALGYTLSNVRVVSNLANMAMNEWGEEPVRAFAHALVAKLNGCER